ncbi:energy-coupling factor ABC transporter ATP-binding protein [Morganella psychrotolerans]|uniref:ABC transporter ATP-binding protein n=1 Tax=Morganella psychrotolerans TaxID=368603 RepID=A0A5M9R042_9GAMM|nr:ABC transporter ATP-binding protein [Morganella psychrotolerans]KAA8713186.1 ABC transporter ATP-binding protein [Morganella psychrotolerans]OBU03688.1 cobalt ABC transporter ATP-binding protein [Morganella psychrotolerans]
MTPQSPLVQVKNLVVRRNTAPIIQDLNFDLNAGERLFLCGDIGSGKSTLLHTLLGFIPFSGEITVFDQRRQSEDDFTEIRGPLGLLFQHPDDQLFGPGVLDDVMFGPLNMGMTPDEARERAIACLEMLDIIHLKDRAVTEISGGEKNFTALAGVLAMSPSVLLLDEPTNGLNEKNIQRLENILRELNLPMIVASHNRQFTESMAHRIIPFPCRP